MIVELAVRSRSDGCFIPRYSTLDDVSLKIGYSASDQIHVKKKEFCGLLILIFLIILYK